MRKTLQKKLTGSMLVAVAAALVIVSVCLLFGMARYASTQFETEVSQVLTTDLLSEMNENATGSADSAAAETEKVLTAYAGQLRLGSGRSYSIWDAATGDRLAGDENAVMTDNIVTAMSGTVGNASSLLPTTMDIAVPVTGESALILDIQDDGSAMRAMMARLAVLLLAGLVLSLIAAAGIRPQRSCGSRTIRRSSRTAIGRRWPLHSMHRRKRARKAETAPHSIFCCRFCRKAMCCFRQMVRCSKSMSWQSSCLA